jgi:iron complex transport system ATP-binding protein
LSYHTRERARLQSYVPQAEGRSNPFSVETFVGMGRYPHLTAFTNLKAEDYRAIRAAIGQAGLSDLRHRAMNTLSGGERQMAFIAAALAQEARIMLLDEPSSFLDYRHQVGVGDILRSACRENGIAVVAVHHDINTAAAESDRMYALKEGKVVFSGTPREAATPDTLQQIYDTRFFCTPSPHGPLPFVTAGGSP